MATSTSRPAADDRPESRLIAQVKECLRKQEKLRHEEISNYPPPIPACDVHFNTLLEERDDIRREINQVDALLETEDVSQAIHHFIDSSKHLDGDAEHKFRAALDRLDGEIAGR